MQTYKIKNIEHHDGFFIPENVVCVVRIFDEVDVILKQNIKITFIESSEEFAIEIAKMITDSIPHEKGLVF
ncbi:hypothetical protein CCF09_003115 [Escherichia coli]|nr:hypothetical protein [Escherichia coli]EEW4440717.1 hypothetical protein [Escherichia coli]EEX1987137.1 hypothetical protein [Escherichia coli]EFA0372476.1 hypothetical protein [Escherichia coli]EFC3607577.1 hypothetical protein [Escherichia coli]